MPPATLLTARLTLRPFETGDAQALTDGIGNYDVARWLGRVPYPYDLSHARAFIARAASQAGRVWAIERDGALIGGIGIEHELGYWLARGHWGQGLALEACDAVIDAYFSDRRNPPLDAGHLPDNARSARVLTKAGFRASGTGSVQARALSQTVTAQRMSLDRADWQARRRYRLRTPRLKLRELRDADSSALNRIAGQDRVARMLPDITVPWPETAVRRWLEGAKYRGRLGFCAAICRRGRLIGTVGIARPSGSPAAICTCFIDPAHWGRGFACEALAAFLSDTMDRFGVAEVWADHFVDNPAGGAVLQRAGFVPTHAGAGISAARVGEHATQVYRLERAALRHP